MLSRKSDPHCVPRLRENAINGSNTISRNPETVETLHQRQRILWSELCDYIQRAEQCVVKYLRPEMRNVNFIREGKVLIYEKFFFHVFLYGEHTLLFIHDNLCNDVYISAYFVDISTGEITCVGRRYRINATPAI